MLSDIRILVTNDDGIDSIGLRVLVEKLKVLTNHILVVAPSKQMSATSHKITLLRAFIKKEEVF